MAQHLESMQPSFRAFGTVAISTEAGGLSEVMDLGGNVLSGLGMSTAWTDAPISFLAGRTSGELQDMYSSTGGFLSIETSASRYVVLSPSDFAGVRFVQLRSGDPTTGVAQGAARSIVLYGAG